MKKNLGNDKMNIRKMNFEDAASVARISTHGWQKAYRGLMPDQFLDSIDINQRKINWEKVIKDDSENVQIVADDNGHILGFASGLLNRFKDKLIDCEYELVAIYVDPNSWRSGIGKMLLNEFKAQLKTRGYQKMAVWVLRDNHLARKFYETEGGILTDATKVFKIGDSKLREVAYKFDLREKN